MRLMSNEFRGFLIDEMQKRQMSAREFASFVEVAATTITRAIDERNPKAPGLDFILKLSKATRISVLTLIELAYPDVVQETAISPSAKVLAQRIEQLPDNLQEAVAAILRGVSK